MIFNLSERVPAIKVLHSKPFALVWVGQFISLVGDNMFRVALAWEVLLLTGSATAMGIVLIVGLIPTIVFLLIGGVIADRLPRRLIMLCSDSCRAVIVLCLAVLGWVHLLQFWHLLLLSFIFGFGDSFFAPAYRSIQPELVEKEQLQSANALTSFGNMMSGLIGPTLGAICITLLGAPSAFAFDALSFLISAGCLLAIRIPASSSVTIPRVDTLPDTAKKQQGIQGMVVDVREGMRYVTGSTWLWATILIASVANITFFGPTAIAMPKLVYDVFKTGVWLLGVLQTAVTIGALCATLLIAQIPHLRRRGLIAYAAMMLSGLALMLLGLGFPVQSEPIVAVVAALLGGFGVSIFGVIWTTVLQELVPADKLGRVASIDMLGSYVLLPAGFALIGVLTDQFGPALLFAVGGTLTFVIAGLGLCIPGIRNLE